MSASSTPVLSYEFAQSTFDIVTVYDLTEIRDVDSLRLCPYCKSQNIKFPEYTESEGLCLCTYCGWWKLLDVAKVSGGFGKKKVRSTTAMAREFAVSSLEVPIRALRRFLANNPNHLAHVEPRIFEKLMQDCLRDAYDPCEVIHIGGTNDGGIDLKLILSNESCYLVQVKRRGNLTKREGVNVVRCLNGVLFREGIPRGMVITTAKSFTQMAVENTVVKTATIIPYDMKLLAFDDVISMLRLKPVLPYEPWKRFCVDRGSQRLNVP